MSAMSYLDFVKSIEKPSGFSSSRVRNERRPAGTCKKLSFENLPVFIAGRSLISESFPCAKRLFFVQALFAKREARLQQYFGLSFDRGTGW